MSIWEARGCTHTNPTGPASKLGSGLSLGLSNASSTCTAGLLLESFHLFSKSELFQVVSWALHGVVCVPEAGAGLLRLWSVLGVRKANCSVCVLNRTWNANVRWYGCEPSQFGDFWILWPCSLEVVAKGLFCKCQELQ